VKTSDRARSIPQLVQLPDRFDYVDAASPHLPVDTVMAFLCAETGDHELDVSDVYLAPNTLGALRQAVKFFLGLKGMPSIAVEVVRFPAAQPTMPSGFALLRPPDDRLVARRARKAGAP